MLFSFKSIKTTPLIKPLSIFMDQSLVASSIAVTVLCRDLKPDWQEVKISFVFRYLYNWSEIIFSKIFAMAEIMEIGR